MIEQSNTEQVIYLKLPQPKWKIEIPKGGNFIVNLDTTLWQRIWFRFIGWGVERNDN